MDEIDPQALIILVIMIIGGLRWMYERLKGEQPEDQSQQPTETFEDLYEEARREILDRQNREYPTPEEQAERLEEYSQPTVYVPQPTVTAPPPVPAAPPPLPTATKHESSTSAYDYNKPAKIAKPQLSAAEQAALAAFQAQGTGIKVKRRRKSASRSKVHALLSSPEATRDAIVLREILGPPKGASPSPYGPSA